MKAAALFAIIAALAILVGAYSSTRHLAEREVWRTENNRLSAEIADLERRVEKEPSQHGMQPLDNGSEQELADATERLSAIETEILENRAELVQLKSDRLVADEHAKLSFDTLRQHVRETTDIEQSLVELRSYRLQIENHIAKAEEEVSELTGAIADRQGHVTSLDRKIAELAVREEAVRSRLKIAEETEMSTASSDDPDEVSGETNAPVQVTKTQASKPKPVPPTDIVGEEASASVDEAAPSDLDRSKGLYRFKALNVDQGLGGPVALSKSETEAADDSAADEQKRSDEWASKQHELGRILVVRSLRNSGTRELNEAVLAFKAVLGELSKDQDPLRWAATQNDLGFALALLGQRQGNVGTLENAAVACRNALAEIKQDLTPLLWATAQYNLGLTLSGIAEIKDDEILWKNAIESFQQSVEVFEEEGADAEEAKAKDRLQNAHDELATLKKQS